MAQINTAEVKLGKITPVKAQPGQTGRLLRFTGLVQVFLQFDSQFPITGNILKVLNSVGITQLGQNNWLWLGDKTLNQQLSGARQGCISQAINQPAERSTQRIGRRRRRRRRCSFCALHSAL